MAAESLPSLQGPLRAVETLEDIAQRYSPANLDAYGHFQRAMLLAEGIHRLRGALGAEVMAKIMPLQNSPLGFLTDKLDGGYGVEVLREALIVAVLQGAYPVGNEFNVIAGKCYLTKQYFRRKLREFQGLTDLRLAPGVPRVSESGALVPFAASWKINGRLDKIECLFRKTETGEELDERICVRVNKGMGADAILGKAERKMLARIYTQLTSSHGFDADDGELAIEANE
jgi:hypothetical protein